jgi:hypothetical protein
MKVWVGVFLLAAIALGAWGLVLGWVGRAGTDFGLTCRIFETPDGLGGSPTVEQLREALRQA